MAFFAFKSYLLIIIFDFYFLKVYQPISTQAYFWNLSYKSKVTGGLGVLMFCLNHHLCPFFSISKLQGSEDCPNTMYVGSSQPWLFADQGRIQRGTGGTDLPGNSQKYRVS